MVEQVHEGAVVVGVHNGDVGVGLPQAVNGRLELLVVVLGEGVVALEAAPIVEVVAGAGHGEEGEVARGAPDREVPRDDDLRRSKLNHLLQV